MGVHYFNFNLVWNVLFDVVGMIDSVKVVRVFVDGQFKAYSLLNVLEAIFGIAVMKTLAHMFLDKDSKGMSIGL